MQRFVQFLGGLVLGGAFGAGLGLLLTPRAGADTRRLIREQVEVVLAEGREAAEARRQELVAQLEALTRKEA